MSENKIKYENTIFFTLICSYVVIKHNSFSMVILLKICTSRDTLVYVICLGFLKAFLVCIVYLQDVLENKEPELDPDRCESCYGAETKELK